MSCECSGVDESNNESTQKPKFHSEIEETRRPYKTIEAIINNNRIVLRIQKLPHEETDEWEPSCDCLPNLSAKPPETKYSDDRPSDFMTSSQSPQFPSTHFTSLKSHNEQLNTPNANEVIANPNIFLLKIRKRSETSDRKKENIDLEFRVPRPWPIPIPKKTQNTGKVLLEIKQSREIENEEKPIPPKEIAVKKNKKKKKKKGKKGKKGKKKKK